MTEEEIKSLVIDTWKLMVANERIIADLPHLKKRKAEARSRNLRRLMHSHIINLLNKNDIELIIYEGTPYDPNYPIEAINTSDFSDDENLIVRETLEPALVKNGQVLHFAKVILTRVENFDK